MATASQNCQQVFEFKASTRVVQHMYNKDSSDISFTFGRRSNDQKQQRMAIYAHKTLLSTLSPVFEAMFSEKWKESKSVEIPDASFEAFNEFIQYFYLDKVAINTENVGEILYLADKYDIPELVSSCSSYLLEHVTLNDVIACISLACKFRFDGLKTACKQIVARNTVQVVGSEAFLKCDRDVLFEILSIESSTCREEIIFDACIKWAWNSCKEQKIDARSEENLRSALGNCFERIRFKEIPLVEFSTRSNIYRNLFTKNEFMEYIETRAKNEENVRYTPQA